VRERLSGCLSGGVTPFVQEVQVCNKISEYTPHHHLLALLLQVRTASAGQFLPGGSQCLWCGILGSLADQERDPRLLYM